MTKMTKKKLILISGVSLAIIFASINAMAYDYVYGSGARPDSALYFADPNTGNWINGINNLNPGEEFDMWLSNVPQDQSGSLEGLEATYWDLMYNSNVSFDDNQGKYQSYLDAGNDPLSDYAFENAPAGWDSHGFVARDYSNPGLHGDVKLMKITMNYDSAGDAVIESTFHWQEVENVNMWDGSAYNSATSPPQQFTYDTITVSHVPIPGTVLLLGSGLVGLFGIRRRRASEA